MGSIEDLILYQQFIETKAKEKSHEILPNAGEKHAAIAMSKLFDATQHIIRMVVGSFSGKISNQQIYLDSLEKCIDNGVRVEVVFLDDPNQDSSAYKLLKAKKNGNNIIFKNASDQFKSLLTKDGKPKHFAVFDEDKFRFEKDTDNYLAWLSFNDKNNSHFLIKYFDQEFNKKN